VISEIAFLDVGAGSELAFEAAVSAAAPLFKRARGCLTFRLECSLEVPSRYWLIVHWETVEDHVVHFRNSDDHAEWHRRVRHHLAVPPVVEHGRAVISSF
jgi:heme-degrading monooxygenase HmoA